MTRVSILRNMDSESVTRGKKIADARRALGWNKAQLARKAGVVPSYVTKLEKGDILKPSLEYMGKIAGALRMAVIDLDGRQRTPLPPDFLANVEMVRERNPVLAETLMEKLASVPDDLRDEAINDAMHAIEVVLRLSRR